jgi:Protein of unknown function (DUF2393)
MAGCKIALMASGEDQTNFLNPGPPKEPRSFLPWGIAGAVVAIILGVLLVTGRRPAPSNPGGAGLAAPDPYAKNLALSNIKMSESGTMIGAKQTYIDGDITNNGSETLTGIMVQVAWRDFTNQIGQKNTMPLTLVRSRQPTYTDIEPVSAAPIQPGQTREFHLIFDHVTDQWNQQYPEIRVIAVKSK